MLSAPFGEVAAEGAQPAARAPLGPRELADLLLAAPLCFRANLVVLEPTAESCLLELKRGTSTLARSALDPEVAIAAALRLATLLGLDPLDISNEVDGAGSARRKRVRCGGAEAELLVSIAARRHGLRVEIRPLEIASDWSKEAPPSSLRRCMSCGALQSAARARCEVDDGTLADVIERAEVGGFLGSYRLERFVGEGGMGVVYAARHGFLGHLVAIKVLHRTMDEDPLAGQRFLAEARIARSVHHENVVTVHDYGLMNDGRPFMVMEYVDGISLADLLSRERSLEPTRALHLTREIARGLAAAHAHGAVHLDLKPANVVLTGDPIAPSEVKLIDFGASVRTGTVGDVGTPSHMSPEHACGEPTDARSDLYALGVVLFEMLSGALPFQAPDAHSLLRAHVSQPAPAVSNPDRALPKAVVQLCARLLEKDPSDRFASAGALIEQVDAAIQILQRKDWLRWLP